jgi:hypothetical protein
MSVIDLLPRGDLAALEQLIFMPSLDEQIERADKTPTNEHKQRRSVI